MKKNIHVQDNLSAHEREAIKELAQAQSNGLIQIKPVDKGGGMAIINLSDYLDEMYSQLNAKFTNCLCCAFRSRLFDFLLLWRDAKSPVKTSERQP